MKHDHRCLTVTTGGGPTAEFCFPDEFLVTMTLADGRTLDVTMRRDAEQPTLWVATEPTPEAMTIGIVSLALPPPVLERDLAPMPKQVM